MKPIPPVLDVARELVGLVFDKITRRTPEVESIVPDPVRLASWRQMVEDADRLEWDDLFDVFPEDEVA